MPPKRKRADNTTETPSRVTRSTTRASSTRDATGVTSVADPAMTMNVRGSKRAKTSARETKTSPKGDRVKQKGVRDSASKARPKANSKTATSSNDDNEPEPRKQETHKEKDEMTLTSRPTVVPSVTKYDPKQSLALFTGYTDGNPDPDVIGPDGFEKMCNDAQIPMDGAMALILSWQLRAQEMASLPREAWIKETDTLRVSSLLQLNLVVRDLNDLLILGRPAIERPTSRSGKDSEPYDRTRYWTYVRDPKAAFQELYVFCFSLAKPQQSRNIDMETAMALWSVLLAPLYPLMSEVLTFMTEKGTYKGVNKDLWNMMLEFCRSVDPSLQGYDSDAAWPTLLDDFVTWKKSKLSS